MDNEDLLQEAFDFLTFSYTFSEEIDDEFMSENWYKDILDDMGDVDPSMN